MKENSAYLDTTLARYLSVRLLPRRQIVAPVPRRRPDDENLPVLARSRPEAKSYPVGSSDADFTSDRSSQPIPWGLPTNPVGLGDANPLFPWGLPTNQIIRIK